MTGWAKAAQDGVKRGHDNGPLNGGIDQHQGHLAVALGGSDAVGDGFDEATETLAESLGQQSDEAGKQIEGGVGEEA